MFLARANSFNVESLRGQAVTKQLRETIDKLKDQIGQRMFDSCLKGTLPDPEEIMYPTDRIQATLVAPPLPPLSP